jgi:hypothetical protein
LSVPQLVYSSFTIFLGTNHPIRIHVKKEPKGNRMSEVRLLQKSKKDIPNNLRLGTAPLDKEHKTPMIQQIIVSIQAPFFLVR